MADNATIYTGELHIEKMREIAQRNLKLEQKRMMNSLVDENTITDAIWEEIVDEKA